jgi:hypothetical protein
VLTLKCTHTRIFGFDCLSLNKQILDVIKDVRVETIILSSFWPMYYYNTFFDNGEGAPPEVWQYVCTEAGQGAINGSAVLQVEII